MRARDNPFASHRLHAVRYRLVGLDWDQLLARLEALGFRAAVVGGEGGGKTALLEALAPLLTARGFRLRRATASRPGPALPAGAERALLEGLTDRDLILLDGADHLGRASWWRLRRRTRAAGGLVIASHRRGLLPTLVECTSTPELLAEIVAELTGDDATAAALPSTDELFARHRGNLRDALRELYDRCAERTGARPL